MLPDARRFFRASHGRLAMADWDPELYHRFRRYRDEPVAMILARLSLTSAAKIVDLGCGTGEHTVELARRSAAGIALGLDSSAAMIDRATTMRASLPEDLRARVTFALGDLRDFDANRKYDVVFSNAAFQWARDHRDLLARCFRALRPSGRLAIQMPANERETAQATIRALADEAPWQTTLGAIRTPSDTTVRTPAEYDAMLAEIGFVDIDCHYHLFRHPMESPAEVVEWSRATTLRPYFDALPADRHDDFIVALTRLLEHAYGTRGPLVFEFRRLFLWARRAAN
jgi:trans-aconitate 2-methyltransferase